MQGCDMIFQQNILTAIWMAATTYFQWKMFEIFVQKTKQILFSEAFEYQR